MKIDALLRLFNAVQVGNKEEKSVSKELLKQTIPNGYVLDVSINPTANLLNIIEETIGINGNKLNSSFHKSWNKVSKASDKQLFIEQITHYITTYGFESIGVFDKKTVYIPNEKLDIPIITDKIPLVFIQGMTSDEILESIINIGSGIALSKQILSDVMEVIQSNKYESSFVEKIKNRELLSLLWDYYGIAPTEPEQFIRYLIVKLTGDSLIIKNNALIEKIKTSDHRILDELIELAPVDLASVFHRYKPLLLAMKSISRNKNFFNKLRKTATTLHKPLGEDYLNNITSKINSATLNFKDFQKRIDGYSVWRKIRLANALNVRLQNPDSIVYKVRNGKGWTTDFSFDGKEKDLEKVLGVTLKSIAKGMKNIKGVTFLIPDYILYALPATEKQFVGNFPANTGIRVDKDLVVGVHWYNQKSHRIDIDLSLLDTFGKYGWDGRNRDSGRDIMFSGDMTDAQLPNGATELFYISRELDSAKSLMANYFNYVEEIPVECQLIVAKTKVTDFNKNYIINPNNILASQLVTIDKKQNTIGLIVPVKKHNVVYFSMSSIGNSITSSRGDMANKTREFLVSSCVNSILLEDVIKLAGGIVVRDIPKENYIDLSPQSISKDTILNLF